MPVHPDVQMMLDLAAAAGRPPMEETTLAEARENYLKMRLAAGAGEPVARVEDILVPAAGMQIPVRLYQPAGDGPFPLVVYFHGGGFVIGNIETSDSLCRGLANRSGCLVASVDYPLAPEHKFPAIPEAAYAATCWLAAHAAELGASGGPIAVAGDSAGGNLAAVVALMARQRGLPAVAFQALIYPVTDCSFDTLSYRENGAAYMLKRSTMIWFWKQYLENEADGDHPFASPLRATELAGLAPALVITAEFDPLRDEGEAYAERLRAAGVAATLHRYDGMVHGFTQLGHILEDGRASVDEIAQALKSALII